MGIAHWEGELFPLPEVPPCREGDLWRLGDHLLCVGDSTREETYEALLRSLERPVQAVITDPPYGEIAASWDRTPCLDWIPFLLLRELVHHHATVASFCSLPYGFLLYEKMRATGYEFRTHFVVEKGNGGFLVSKQMPIVCHDEVFLFAHRQTKPTDLTFHGYEAGEQGTPWGFRLSTPSPEGAYTLRKDAGRQDGREDGKRWIRSVVRGRKKQALPEELRTSNPSQKAPEVVETLVRLLSDEAAWVFDPFLGGGTTLYACEKLGRRCLGVELRAEQAHEVLVRWQRLTQRQPELIERRGENALPKGKEA